jgi:hypothetical protein
VAPDLAELERSLWDGADELRANSGLKASKYGGSDHNFAWDNAKR